LDPIETLKGRQDRSSWNSLEESKMKDGESELNMSKVADTILLHQPAGSARCFFVGRPLRTTTRHF
jgi:hypothetical protein